MLFDVEQDLGHRIIGYLVPDSYSAGATVKITVGDLEVAVLKANEVRSSVVTAGRHGTGHCGFVLTDDNVPNLSQLLYLEIRDADSDLVIYRRRPAESIVPFKLFRLETQHERSMQLDRELDGFFQLSFPDVDRRGRETASQSFLLGCTSSLYVSARMLYREYEHSIENDFRKICLLQDPYCELAETILSLWRDGAHKATNLSLREELALGAGVEYISSLDVADFHALQRGLSRLPVAVETVLSNPLARSLAARTNDDSPNATYVSASLASLSAFDIVGIRERPETFFNPLAELLKIEVSLLPVAAVSDAAINLANFLRTSPAASALVDMDLEIYEAVRGAVDANF